MKYKQLFEGPVFIPSSPREQWESDDYISYNYVAKNYVYLGTAKFNNKAVNFYESHNKKQIIGVIKSSMPWDIKEIGYHEIFVLWIKDVNVSLPTDLQHTNIIQIMDASTDVNFAGRGLATFVYFNILVDKLNYIIVCDEQHMYGGIRLWRKMSRAAMQYGKIIYLIKDGQYILDKNNQPLVFDDTNFPKSKIWSTLPNDRGKNVLFVIKNKL